MDGVLRAGDAAPVSWGPSTAKETALPLVPKVMSTQHPDNAAAPSYAIDGVIKGEGEIIEAVDVFTLGCDEQMWDSEGKDTDTHVVQKLLTNYPEFFNDEIKLGRDAVITLRVPNPAIETEMRKLMVEALQGVTTAYDVASEFYGGDLEAPIQEVILPFTTSADELSRIAAYYERFIVGQENQPLFGGDSVGDWIGEFQPKRIRVIPLVEDRDQMVAVDSIVRTYLQEREEPYQRVFLARSDPALNYGMVGAELMLKTSLQRLDLLSRELGIPIYPIIGAGSVPFRGHLKPTNIDRAFREYPSVHTLTVQSAFKFDYPREQVRTANRGDTRSRAGPGGAHRRGAGGGYPGQGRGRVPTAGAGAGARDCRGVGPRAAPTRAQAARGVVRLWAVACRRQRRDAPAGHRVHRCALFDRGAPRAAGPRRARR